MAAKQKDTLPQEGTGLTGESLPEPSSGCPSYSGGGNVLPQMDSTHKTTQSLESKLVQQTFHKSMFHTRMRSNSLTNLPHQTPAPETVRDMLNRQVQQDKTPEAVQNHPEWQRVPMMRNAKRRRTSPSPTQETLKTTNRYSNLPIDLMDDMETPTEKKQPKPPPIMLYGIEDVHKLMEMLEHVAERTKFSLKIVNKNQLRISCTEVETYRTVIATVREKGLIGHTFNRKDQRCYRIVIRNLHHTTPHNEIRDAIKSTGNEVSGEIINARYGPEKTPTSTFFVNIQPSPNNKEVKELRYIYNQSVVIEDPRKKKNILQCQRCQQYGHSKNYCLRPYRCVKCAESHKTSECPKKDRNSPAQCALCLGPHPANFKGCEVYKEILLRKRPSANLTLKEKTQRVPRAPRETAKASHTQENAQQNEEVNDKRSYAETTKLFKKRVHVTSPPATASTTAGPNAHDRIYKTQTSSKNSNTTPNHGRPEKTSPEHSVEQTTLEILILKQAEKFDQILQQMSSLIGLITTLLTKVM